MLFAVQFAKLALSAAWRIERMNCPKCKTSWSINGKCQYCGTPMPVDELTAARADNEALRKELAEAKAALARTQDASLWWDQYNLEVRKHADTKAALARIAELEANPPRESFFWPAERVRSELCLAVARAERAEARVAELGRDNTAMREQLDRDHAAMVEGTASIVALRKELAICQEANASWHESYCQRHNDSIEARKRAQRAEGRIAELEATISAAKSEAYYLGKRQGQEDFKVRAERAEAEADSLRATIDNMRAMNIKLTMEAAGQVLAAEAECKAMREASAALNPSEAKTK